MDDDDDLLDVSFDIHILENARQPLYEGSKTSLIIVILFLVNLKVCFIILSYIFCLLIYVQLSLIIMFDIFYLLIYVLIMYCVFNQLGKYQFKDMNVYIEPLIDELLELWKCINMYDISRLVNAQREFQFHAMLVWTIHDAPGIKHFCGML
jgi:hypothetical protein